MINNAAVRVFVRHAVVLGIEQAIWCPPREMPSMAMAEVNGMAHGLTTLPPGSVRDKPFIAHIIDSSNAVTANDFSRHSGILASRNVMKSIAERRN